MDGIRTLYDWVRATRRSLFDYLEGWPVELYLRPLELLAGESVRDRHVHVAECYVTWLATVGLEEGSSPPSPGEVPDVRRARALFAEVDRLVERFLGRFEGELDRPLARSWRGERRELTPRWLLAHPITHEFHHKGQIVLAGRWLGRPAPDTDLLFPEEAAASPGPAPLGRGAAASPQVPAAARLRIAEAEGAAGRAWLAELWRQRWGGAVMVTRGRLHRLESLQAAIAYLDGEPAGAATWYVEEGECELVSLDAVRRGRGVGSALLAAVEEHARAAGCRRLWLVTSNDNLEALRFYQRRGYRIAAVHAGAVDAARRLKPAIPEVGDHGIPVRDEIELEKRLQETGASRE
ncbi:MAG: DinB family protein [Bacillota bacterium]|nr:DinB family protein [Bacillota bacterium]